MSKETRMTALMLMGTVFWAGAFITGKMGVNVLSPILLTFLRMALSALIIFPGMIIVERSNWKIERERIKYAMAASIVGMIGYHVFFFYALRYTEASKASIINGVNPLVTAILAAVFLKEKLSWRKISLILIAFIGVTLTLSNWDIKRILQFDLNIGDLFMLLGSSLWAAYSIVVKKILPYFTPLKLTSYTFLFSALILLPFALPELIGLNYGEVGWMPFLAVLYMAVFPSVLGYTIQQMAIQEMGAGKTALFINLVPVFSTVFAVVFLKESLFKLNIISGLMILGSVMLFRKQKT